MLTSSRGVGLLESLEEAAHLLVGETDAGIGDGEVDELAVVVFLLDSSSYDDFALFGEFYSVVAEIDEDLTEAKRIALRMSGDCGIDVKNKFEALGSSFFRNEVADIFEDLLQIEVDVFDSKLAGFDFGEVENVIDDAEEMLTRLLNLADITFLARVEVGLEGQMGHADDGVHRSADFVTHVGEEFGFNTGCFFGRVFIREQFRFSPPALRDIPEGKHGTDNDFAFQVGSCGVF